MSHLRHQEMKWKKYGNSIDLNGAFRYKAINLNVDGDSFYHWSELKSFVDRRKKKILFLNRFFKLRSVILNSVLKCTKKF